MKSLLITAAAVVGFAGVALAGGPQLLTDNQMDQVVAGGYVDLGGKNGQSAPPPPPAPQAWNGQNYHAAKPGLGCTGPTLDVFPSAPGGSC